MIECAFAYNLTIKRIEKKYKGYKCNYKSRLSHVEWLKLLKNKSNTNKLFCELCKIYFELPTLFLKLINRL